MSKEDAFMYYLAQLRVLDDRAIAAKFLLEILQDFVVAELFLQSLNSGQALPSVSLLYTDMHILL